MLQIHLVCMKFSSFHYCFHCNITDYCVSSKTDDFNTHVLYAYVYSLIYGSRSLLNIPLLTDVK